MIALLFAVVLPIVFVCMGLRDNSTMTKMMAVLFAWFLIGSCIALAASEGRHGSSGLVIAGLLFVGTNIALLLDEIIRRLRSIDGKPDDKDPDTIGQ